TLVRLWLQRVPAIGLTHTTTNRVSAARPLTVFVLRARRGSGVEWKERRGTLLVKDRAEANLSWPSVWLLMPEWRRSFTETLSASSSFPTWLLATREREINDQ